MRITFGWVLALCLLLISAIPSSAQVYTIQLVDVSNCFGGAPCLTQARVTLKNAQGLLAPDFVGSAYIQMGSSPSGFETLYLGTCDINGQCGTKVSGRIASVRVINGFATFSNLMIKTAGVGYTLRVVVINSKGFAVASASTAPFAVSMGPIFKLQFRVAIGAALGGHTFSPDPKIAVVDRGDNVAVGVSGATCTAYMSDSPTGTEVLYPLVQAPVEFEAGIATFTRLYINPAGFPYQVSFNTSSTAGITLPTLSSGLFRVSIGPPSAIVPDTSYLMSSVPILAGEYLKVTPKLTLLDKGGNIVAYDSTSRINITLDSNPSGSYLTSVSSHTSVATSGVITFSVLKMDKVGLNYRFKYVLSTFSALTRVFTTTAIVAYSEFFDIGFGPPRSIEVLVPPNIAIAGGQAFGVQPKLQLLDYGSNVLSTDYTSKVVCSMVESLAASTVARQVDTRSSTLKNSVKSVTLNVVNGTYGKGQLIVFSVNFLFEIYLEGPSVPYPTPKPYLILKLTTTNDLVPKASQSGALSGVSVLQFYYKVRQGDATSALDYKGIAALQLNATGIRFVDGNNRSVSLLLPARGLPYHGTVAISTLPPIVVRFSTSIPDGVYGAGESITFNVTYDYSIQVTGIPYLLLTALSGNTSVHASTYAKAFFSSINSYGDSRTLIFTYTVVKNDHTVNQNLTVYNSSIQLPRGAVVQRLSNVLGTGTYASTSLSLYTAAFAASHHIVVDKIGPSIDLTYGVRTNHANGTYYPGEKIFITIRFTKPVVALGVSINIYLQTGSPRDPLNGIALLVRVLEDDITLLFEYTVVPATNTSRLDIINNGAAIFVSGVNTYIRRKATIPTLDANVSTSALYHSGNSLGQTANIQLDGYQPTVTKVTIIKVVQQFPLTKYLYPDDKVYIRLTYSTRVMSVCPPILMIDAGTFTREAPLIAGNQTQYLTFLYTVQTGDNNPDGVKLSYSNPPPFCSTSGCSTFPKYCGIFANATTSAFAANLGIPYTIGRQATGITVPKGNYTILPRSLTRNTSVISVNSRLSSGSYSPGTLVYIDVTFKDVAVTNAEPYPSLYLNIGKYATYSSGFSTLTLSFLYITQSGDSIAALRPAFVPGTTSILQCRATDTCFVTNAIMGYVNLSTPLSIIKFATIALDGAIANITKVYTNLPTSPFDGYYTIGQLINIHVIFSRPVVVVGSTSRMQMNIGILRYAYYIPSLSTPSNLVYQLLVQSGDATSNLAYSGPSIDLMYGTTTIYRLADIPSAAANLTLPDGSRIVALHGNIIKLDTSPDALPHISSVHSADPNTSRIYRAGDSMLLCLAFSHSVVLTGRGYLSLNLGKQVGVATFVGASHSAALLNVASGIASTVDIPTNSTRQLYFYYTVSPGDFSNHLDYTDTFAFNPGLTDNLLRGAILLSVSTPDDLISVALPIPGTYGSLSSKSTLYVDGSPAYMTALSFITPPGKYSIGDLIHIRMNFSASVVVTGAPYLVLTTGEAVTAVRNASYVSGSGSASIVFLYAPAPGDYTPSLDYRGDSEQLNSALSSFQLNGGSILVGSASPVTPVSIVLSPPVGHLTGTRTVTAVGGAFTFVDLAIDAFGLNYLLRFSGSPIGAHRLLSTTSSLFVSFSSQFAIRPAGAFSGDRVCRSIAISGKMAVCGAPASNDSVTPIQSVSISVAGGSLAVSEIQSFSPTIAPNPAVQQFYTTAGIGATVGGSYSLKFGTLGASYPIPSNANTDMVTALLKASIPEVGDITVSREDYIYCACYGAYTWTVTFNDYSLGVIPAIVFDRSSLTGSQVGLIGPTILQVPAKLGGSFAIQLMTAAGLQQSSFIPYDASVVQVAAALKQLTLSSSVIASIPDQAGIRMWTATFGVYLGAYAVPLLSLNTSRLTGGVVGGYVEINRRGILGPGGITGGFVLEWRGNSTSLLSYNVSAVQMKAALEALPVIDTVNVARTSLGGQSQYMWVIEFVQVNRFTSQGYVMQPTQNVESIIAHSYLNGADAVITVLPDNSPNASQVALGPERLGEFGANAGLAYVYSQLTTGKWVQIDLLRGTDTAAGDQFGYSVALKGQVMLIGAITGSNEGVLEIQSVFCSAQKGFFRLSFRGWTTDLLGVNITRAELTAAIVSTDPSKFTHMYSVTSVSIADWGGGGLCHNKTAVITFNTPNNGDYPFFGVDNGPELELLEVVKQNLKYNNNALGVVVVTELQRATRIVNTIYADVQQQGAAYLFYETDGCQHSVNNTCLAGSKWTQEMKFSPVNPTGSERFGFSVALETGISVVGSPGSNFEGGAVYVYVYSTIANVTAWTLLQQLSALTTVQGDNFGYSVAVQSRTLVVGALSGAGGTGAVYVFRAAKLGQPYGSEQLLIPAAASYVLQVGDQFGFSLAMSGDILVVGCPTADDTAIYLGSEASSTPLQDSGAVFVFQRTSSAFKFTYLQKLVGTNVRSFDRLGYSVDIKGKTILVGAVEDFTSALGPSRAVTQVSTQCTYGSSVGSTFKLIWDVRKTRDIGYDVSAVSLANILETDLSTGPVLVSRSKVNIFNGGYVWTVTFLELDYLNNGYDFSPILTTDYSALTGANASASVTILWANNQQIRGKTHVFQRNAVTYGSFFIEQLHLSPFIYQPADQCGYDVALLDDYYAFVGCPNSDGVVPNTYYGGGIFYNLTLLRLKFSDYNYSVVEGRNVTLSVMRDSDAISGINDVQMYVATLDRNAPLSAQLFARRIYNILDSNIPHLSTVLDASGLVGKAVGRSQYYGSIRNQSSWVYGMCDYRGISDYVPFSDPVVLAKAKSYLEVQLITNMDGILEAPDETVTVTISSPGLWPSILGRFYTSVTLLDANDGYANGLAQYAKVYDVTLAAGIEFGHAVAVLSALQVMFSSAPLADVGTCVQCGKVSLSTYAAGSWSPRVMLSSPAPSAGSFYGDEVVASYNTHQNLSLLIVGEPGINAVHVYLSQGTGLGYSYTFEATLTAPQAVLQQHRFGGKGAIAISGSLLIVGAPGLEVIYAFRRVYSASTRGYIWTDAQQIVSSDYDYDLIDSDIVLHTLNFGKSVAASGRSIAVGAPFADYGNLGSGLVEVDIDTEGQDIFGYGRGKAYVFSSSPAVQLITLEATQPLASGQFQLVYNGFGSNQTTGYLNFNMTLELMTSHLMALSNIDVVAVTVATDIVIVGGFRSTWSVTFLDMWQEPSVFVPIWHNFGCPSCRPFDFNSTVPSRQVRAKKTSLMGAILQDQTISASDARNGNRFGWSVALDGNQLAVGAIFSAAATTTTWDFEAGILRGWTATGTAFAFQPTFGDNSRYRIVERISQTTQAGSSGQSSRMRGLYYIGTFEKRPGNTSDYTIANSKYAAGNAQGDKPQGVLTSDVFIIYGKTISFLLGGGCDYYTVYVELLIDGLSVTKVTGKCEERMRKASFDTTFLQLRAAQIRIVDASSGVWGHINVDEIKFDWATRGASINDSTPTAAAGSTYNGRDTAGGAIETPHSGAAYTFRRHKIGSDDICLLNVTLCAWTQEAQLSASDKRENAMFGSTLAINDAAGIVLVGAPNSAFTGYYREVQSVYPYQDPELMFPVSSRYSPIFQGINMYTPEATGAYGYWYLEQLRGITYDTQPFEQAGGVYVYVRTRPLFSSTGSVAIPQQWTTTELVKIQPPDAFARDLFGSSLSFDGSLLAVGAVGQDGAAFNGGAVYLYNMHFAACSFSQAEYHVIEGTDFFAVVVVKRDLLIFSGEMTLHYATSDLTATGVDYLKYAACQRLATLDRGAALCGDYQQTSGIMIIPEGASSGSLQINILNDNCKERFMKYIQVTLSVPGSASLQGQSLLSRVRIDDDDFLQDVCVGLS